MPGHKLTELIGPPERGRTFTGSARAGLADCVPGGRVRLDVLARWLQDLAFDDVEDAGLQDAAVWVVRRSRLRVERFPRFGERHRLLTYCSGMGRMWAERRTTISLDGEAARPHVEGVSLWVHLDAHTRRPSLFSEPELRTYEEAARGRRVGARLRHPAPPDPPAERYTWTFRATERDLADHINNAAYWQPVEEHLLDSVEPDSVDAEMEFRTPAQPGQKNLLRNRNWLWIVDPAGDVHATVVALRR